MGITVPFGRYSRISPFVFSFVGRSHGECGLLAVALSDDEALSGLTMGSAGVVGAVRF